jgi:hypothetical protein
MKVGLLTIEQKELIDGGEFAPDCFFNPIQDNSNNWIISLEEMNGRVTNPEFFWVRDLPKIEYVPKLININ